MKIKYLKPPYPQYLTKYIQLMGKQLPSRLCYQGNLRLLKNTKLAVFCSSKCPGSLIIKSHDYFRKQKDSRQTYMSGFHSPVEKECLRLILKNKQPVIIWLARELENHRIPTEWKTPLAENTMLLISPFDEKTKRLTRVSSDYRNRCVSAFADQVLIIHAAEQSKTKEMAILSWAWQKKIMTIADEGSSTLQPFIS